MADFRPWDITKLVSGGFVTALAPLEDAPPIPTWIDDFRAMEDPYAFVDPYSQLGASVDAKEYTTGHETQGLQIQEESADILDQVSGRSVGFKTDVAEIAPENMGVIENSRGVEAVSASSGVGAGTAVGIADFDDLIHYRGLLMGLRPERSGLVVESDGTTKRGRIVAVVLWDITLAAEQRSIGFDKNGLGHANVTVKAYPDPTQPTDFRFGRWMFEAAGSIPA